MKASGLVLVIRSLTSILTVTNRRYGGYGLPGSKCEEGDCDPKAAAVRELAEETGLQVYRQDLTLCAVGRSSADSDRQVHVYHAARVYGAVSAREEGTEVNWQSMDNLAHASPFAHFYTEHFPDGIGHMMLTISLPYTL